MGHPLWAEGRGVRKLKCRGRRSLPWTGGAGSVGPKHVPTVVGLQAPQVMSAEQGSRSALRAAGSCQELPERRRGTAEGPVCWP